MITHLEADILECEVKWAAGSITMNKTGGGDGIPDELFQILKDDAVKVLYSLSFGLFKYVVNINVIYSLYETLSRDILI